MHLVIVSPFPPAITGIGQYGYHLTRALASSGLFSRLTVLAGSAGGGASLDQLGLTEVEYCWQPDSRGAQQAILTRLRQLHPDIVWFNMGASIFGKSPLSNLSGLMTPMRTARMFPTVVTMHELVALADLRTLNAPGGIFAPFGARLLTMLTAQADLVCLTMRHYADWLSSRGVECAHIPLGAYHEPELLRETGNRELLFFTTLAPYKGLELLIPVFLRLRGDYPDLRLTIAGASHTRFPGYAREIQAQFRGTRGIEWLGEVPEDRIKSLFQCAQVVVLPYSASTGSSSVLYQAAAWGRAVVASDLDEIKKMALDNNLRVEFFEKDDPVSLYRSLHGLLGSATLRQSQAEHNLNAVQHLRPQVTCHRYLQAFNRILEKRQSAKRIPLLESV